MGQEVSYIIRARDAFSGIHKKADSTIDNTAQTFKRSAGVMTVAVGGVSASLFAMMKTTANSADHLAKLEARLGVSAEGFSSLAYAAEMSDISMSTLEMSMQRQTRRLSEAAQGTGQAVKALEALGLEAKTLKDLKPEDAFMKIAAAMEGVPSKADRARIAMQLWDTEGVKLTQMIDEGTASIEEMRAKAELLGLTFDSQAAAASAKFNDELADLGNAAIGVKNELSTNLIPYFGEFTGMLNESLLEIKKSGDLDVWAADVSEGVITAFSATAELATNIPMVWHASMVSVKTIAANGVAIIDTVLLGVEKFYSVMAHLPGDIGTPYQQAANDIHSMRDSLSDIGTDLLVSADASSQAGEEWAVWQGKAISALDGVRARITEENEANGSIGSGTKPEDEIIGESDAVTEILITNDKRMAQSSQWRASIVNKANSEMQNTILGLIETGKFSVGAFAQVMAQQIKVEAAGIAARASLRALYELAMGYATAYVNPAASASHFTAASQFSATAAYAGLAGAAVHAMSGGSAQKPAAGTAGGDAIYTQPAAGTSLIGSETESRPQQNITIEIKGDYLTGDSIRGLAEPLVEELSRGGKEQDLKISVEALAV